MKSALIGLAYGVSVLAPFPWGGPADKGCPVKLEPRAPVNGAAPAQYSGDMELPRWEPGGVIEIDAGLFPASLKCYR